MHSPVVWLMSFEQPHHAVGDWSDPLSTAGAGVLLAHQEGRGLTFKVEVGFAAHVDDDPVDGAAGEAVRPFAGVVRRHWVADIAALRPGLHRRSCIRRAGS